MTRVLVTGGAGYVGSHTVKRLRTAGHAVTVLDDLSSGHHAALGGAAFILADLRNAEATRAAIARSGCEVVIHFAARSEVGLSRQQPGRFYEVNVLGGLNLLEGMRAAGVTRLVFSSTCAVYGHPAAQPIGEGTPVAPISTYGHTKATFEGMLEAYSAAHEFSSVCLRYFNAAGADPDGELGEDHRPESHLLPLAILAAQGRAAPLTILGDDYPTPDGTCVRDYVHVADLAEAHLRAIELVDALRGEVVHVNLGTGRGYSVREVLRGIEEVAGVPVPHRTGPRRAGDPPILTADARRAASLLSWEPRFSQLDTILRTAWAWHARNPAGYGRPDPRLESREPRL